MTKISLEEYLSRLPNSKKWERFGFKKRSGVLVPLFSVYSQNSLGIGDFSDLRLLVDWCVLSGNSILQLLPMNDLGVNFCPYDALSLFALEPSYICVDKLLTEPNILLLKKIEDIKKEFSDKKGQVDYKIKEGKLTILWDIYLQDKFKDSEEYKKFSADNVYWLEDFCFFKVLKKHNNGLPWYEWPGEYRNRDKVSLDDCHRIYHRDIEFLKWLQWKLYQQFKEAKEYASSRGVFIKGDLPILAGRDSADVWAHQEFFKLEYAAGSPPDMYCSKGQRWGSATYNWENIYQDDLRYLKEKVKFCENFYDILRVDHVVGLFRIWTIPHAEPMENQGLNGSFDPVDEKVWPWQGRRILSVMQESTDMLLCAEDLGIIPKVCPQTLEELGVPGNDVQRWAKDWLKRHDFLSPDEYRILSVAVLSTHDTTNWAAWWENEAGTVDEGLFRRRCTERGIYFNVVKTKLFDFGLSGRGRLRWLNSLDSVDKLVEVLGRDRGELTDFIGFYENTFQEKEKLWKQMRLPGNIKEHSDNNIVREALKIALESRSVFSIQLMTDWMYLDDILSSDPYIYRVNTPGTVSEKNWSLVLPLSLEKLLEHPVNNKIKELIVSSGRI
ncbi:MAG: 4-alpha-glucanotransferase [Candidatus Omnitrophota bacterium]